eukprot:CAMPEP_0119368706 /NCGR_PEP_ID=MMETSP1334-20130426/15320_1 /TAXON_ID=127549 /ORGANISM="Calcidiscus leptoporus, Strain RCC1130" /LENGTH=55 /DNA_ID=CAMNT_0007385401 /DNA_START=216 /DNA_END=383 /DNA_ORIENTATION=+
MTAHGQQSRTKVQRTSNACTAPPTGAATLGTELPKGKYANPSPSPLGQSAYGMTC